MSLLPLSRLILGYHDTRDKISLYTKGSGGVDELRANLKDEVLYGFVRIDDRYALLAYVSEHVRYVFLHDWRFWASFSVQPGHNAYHHGSTPGQLLLVLLDVQVQMDKN